MARQELVDWCKNYIASGYSQDQLRDYLLKQGYDAAEVEEAVSAAMEAQKPPAPKPQAPAAQAKPAAAQKPFQAAQPVSKPVVAQPAPQPIPVQKPAPTPAPTPVYSPVQVPLSTQGEPEQPKPSGIPFLAIGVALVLIIFAVGIIYVVSNFNFFGTPANTGNNSTVEVSTPEEPPPTVKPPPAELNETPVPCNDLACFNAYFRSCEQATFTYSGQGTAIRYAIVGPVSSDCEVTARYQSYSNTSFIGKEMSCVYDNSVDFAPSAGVPKAATCSGELYTLLVQEAAQPPPRSANCSLKPLLTQAQIDNGLQMQKGISNYITVTGFKGKNTDISWASKDPSIATMSPLKGATIIAKALSSGTTQLIATDNAASPPCSTYITIVVLGPSAPPASSNPIVITSILAGIGGNAHVTVTNAGTATLTVKSVTLMNETHQVDWTLASHDQAELILSGTCMGKTGIVSLGSARFSYLDNGVAKTGTQDNVSVDCGYSYNY